MLRSPSVTHRAPATSPAIGMSLPTPTGPCCKRRQRPRAVLASTRAATPPAVVARQISLVSGQLRSALENTGSASRSQVQPSQRQFRQRRY
jgi:hypothetical protein